MTAPVSGHAAGEVVFRLSRGFRYPLLQRGTAALIFTAITASAAKFMGRGFLPVAAFCGLVTAGYAVTYLWRGRFRTVVTVEGIRICGYFNHFVPWAKVVAFAVRSNNVSHYIEPGSSSSAAQLPRMSLSGRLAPPPARRPGDRSTRLSSVRVVQANGRRLLLRAPLVAGWQGDPEFEDKVRLLEKWRKLYGAPSASVPGG